MAIGTPAENPSGRMGFENACYRDKSSHPRIFAKLHRLHQHEHCPCCNHKVQVALQVVGKCHIMPVSNVAMATYFIKEL